MYSTLLYSTRVHMYYYMDIGRTRGPGDPDLLYTKRFHAFTLGCYILGRVLDSLL